MEAVLGPIAAKLDTNVRVVRGTALSTPTVNTSTQFDRWVGLPSGQNAVFEGVAAEDFVETGFSYVAGTDPSTVTGTTPAAPYNLQGKRISAVLRGMFPMLAAGAITQGAPVIIADAFGRVQPASVLAAGSNANVVGKAKTPAAAVNDYVYVDVAPSVQRI
jgi:hypothetical protein